MQIGNECDTILKLCKDVIIKITPPQCVRNSACKESVCTINRPRKCTKKITTLKIYLVDGKTTLPDPIYFADNFLLVKGNLQIGRTDTIINYNKNERMIEGGKNEKTQIIPENTIKIDVDQNND